MRRGNLCEQSGLPAFRFLDELSERAAAAISVMQIFVGARWFGDAQLGQDVVEFAFARNRFRARGRPTVRIFPWRARVGLSATSASPSCASASGKRNESLVRP